MSTDGTEHVAVAVAVTGDGPNALAASVRRNSWIEIICAVAAFVILCIVALSVKSQFVEPDDYTYQASIVAASHGEFFALTPSQVTAIALETKPKIPWQFVEVSGGRWISEKNPGYPFLALPFQWLGIIRLAPLCYGALACLGLFVGARRWLGRFGGATTVGLYCLSGAALYYAWRDFMPTFTEASLIAAGAGTLLWVLLAEEAPPRRRVWLGLLGFVALELAVFVRYSDILLLACVALAVLAAKWLRPASVPPGALRWWLGSVALSLAGIGLYNGLVYGGPFNTGYAPGEVDFGFSYIATNLRYTPAHVIDAMPVLVLGVAGLVCVITRWAQLRRTPGEVSVAAHRDLAIGVVLAVSWFILWGLYAAYSWTANPGLATLQVARFYVSPLGLIALLGAWPLVRLASRPRVAVTISTAAVLTVFGLGVWSYSVMQQPLSNSVVGVNPCAGLTNCKSNLAPAHPTVQPANPINNQSNSSSGTSSKSHG